MMLYHTDRKPLISPLGTISVLVFQLILTHFCRGQSRLIGSSQPIVATLGDNIILPCYLEHKKDATGLTLVWTRPDLNPRFVYVWRSGQELVGKKHKSFEGRTSLFIDELKNGNISLKLSKVKFSDVGTYRCFIPALEKESFVQLVIASNAVSLPVITLAGIDTSSSGVVLQCESKGWYPEPEVLWLDGEGNLVSAGPTETVRGPDDLYTVSSRVTVDKRHSNRFTCRVQQNNINQTRETHIHVPGDFFYVQSSIFPATVGLAVCLAVCILSILSLTLFFSKKKNVVKSKKRQWDENDKGQRKNRSSTRKTEDQVFIEERESEQLMTDNTVQIKDFEGEKTKHVKFQTSKEHQKKVEAENTVKTLEEELETKKKEVENKETELQQLREENQKRENNLQTLKNNLEDKNKELETVRDQQPQWRSWRSREKSQNKKMEIEKEVETLKNQLETMETELQAKIKEIKDKQAEVQQLQDEIQMMETNLQTLMKNKSGRSRAAPAQSSSSSLVKVQIVSNQRFYEDKQRREEAERQVQSLETEELEENQTDNNQLHEETQEREKAEREVETLKNQLEEIKDKQTDVQQLQDEIQMMETNLQTLMENKTKSMVKGDQDFESQLKLLSAENEEIKTEHTQLKINQQSADIKWNETNERLERTQYELDQTKRHVHELMAEVKKFKEEKQRSETEQQQPQKELETKKQEDITVVLNSDRQYICLRNLSNKDQHLGGWKLKLQINKENPIMYKFKSSFILKAQATVKLWVPGCCTSKSPTDLVWKDLKSWKPEDKLQLTLNKSK